jgi:hypothetical protein
MFLHVYEAICSDDDKAPPLLVEPMNSLPAATNLHEPLPGLIRPIKQKNHPHTPRSTNLNGQLSSCHSLPAKEHRCGLQHTCPPGTVCANASQSQTTAVKARNIEEKKQGCLPSIVFGGRWRWWRRWLLVTRVIFVDLDIPNGNQLANLSPISPQQQTRTGRAVEPF